MLNKEIINILASRKSTGWILEPEAKRIFEVFGLNVPEFSLARTKDEAVKAATEIGYPVVAKIVSPKVLHKSELNGVVLGITDAVILSDTFDRFKKISGFEGILVEETIKGVELIVGAKIDDQFGPVVLLGIGGTGVELYKDTALRMAPIERCDVISMIKCLKAYKLLEGYRGSAPVNMDDLTTLIQKFSVLIMDLKDQVESIDLNPVMCNSQKCVIADARIILRSP